MPIRPENKALYPPPAEWKVLRETILARAGNCCEQCKAPNHETIMRGWCRTEPGGPQIDCYEFPDDSVFSAETGRKLKWYQAKTGKKVRVVLTISHTDHDPTNNSLGNLRALCQRCHNRHDAEHRARNRRRNRHADAGQLQLQLSDFDGGVKK